MIPLHKIINRPSRWLKSLAGAAALALGLTISAPAATPTYQQLKSFGKPSSGAIPYAGLMQGADGALYGTASSGGSSGSGTVFKLNPDGTGFTVLLNFDNLTTGAYPPAGLMQGADGNLYGTTYQGGNANVGTVFRLVFTLPNTPPVATCTNVTVSAGVNGTAAASIDNGSSDPDAADTITLTQNPAGPYALGATLVTLTVTDNHGASQTCTATVTVEDTTAPVLTCLPDLVVVSDRSACALGDHDDNDWAHHSREGRQRDEGENHGGCLNNRGGDDNDSHGYTCRFWTRCRATGVVLVAPVATDNSGAASVVSDHPSTTYPLGVTWVTWTATDGSGNFSTCVQKVTVVASVEISFRTPVVRKPTSNTIRRGQVVPFVVELASCLAQTVRSGVTVTLQVQGIVSSTGVVFQDVVEDASGMGTDGTLTSNGLMQLRDSKWQFKLDTGNFGDENTIAGDRFYRATVIVKDNATQTVVGMGSVNMETRRK